MSSRSRRSRRRRRTGLFSTGSLGASRSRRRLPVRRMVGAGVAVAVLAAGLVAAFSFAAGDRASGTSALKPGPTVSVALQVDRATAVDYAALGSSVRALAMAVPADEDGRVLIHKGGTAFVSVASVRTAVLRDGAPEQTPSLRSSVLGTRIRSAMTATERMRTSGSGRDVLGLLRSVQSDRPAHGTWTILFDSLGLGTVTPLQQQVLQAGEPQSAAATVARADLPDLDGARVTWLVPAAAGAQEPLNAVTAAWRDEFITSLLHRAGAASTSIVESNRPGVVDPASPTVPAVPNIVVSTPKPPAPPKPGTAYVATIDAAASFVPGDSTLLDPAATRRALGGIVAAWRTGDFSSIDCVGHALKNTEPYPGFDRVLSARRAAVIAEELTSLVPGATVTHRGVGHDQPVPGADQRVVRCIAVPR